MVARLHFIDGQDPGAFERHIEIDDDIGFPVPNNQALPDDKHLRELTDKQIRHIQADEFFKLEKPADRMSLKFVFYVMLNPGLCREHC